MNKEKISIRICLIGEFYSPIDARKNFSLAKENIDGFTFAAVFVGWCFSCYRFNKKMIMNFFNKNFAQKIVAQ